MMDFQNKNILVLGDVMLDKYTFGEVERISPEAPIPIVSVERETFVPGGAANTANNIASLGGLAHLSGVVGFDQAREVLLRETQTRNIDTSGLIAVTNRRTIQKVRIIAQSQQLLRIDFDQEGDIDSSTTKSLIESFVGLKNLSAFVVSDYAKGVVTETIMEAIKDYVRARNIPLIVDPKPQHKAWYKDAYLITPNKKEAEGMVGRKIQTQEDVTRAGRELMGELNAHILMTMGERGMSLFERGAEPVHIPTHAKEVYDVSGAGDTVVAALSLALCSGASLREAAILANDAAGIKVGKFGTAPVTYQELKAYLS